MQSIYHNPPAIDLALEKFSVDRFVSSTVSCARLTPLFNQDRMIYESNAFTEHRGCRL
jgi:hypothetical protein